MSRRVHSEKAIEDVVDVIMLVFLPKFMSRRGHAIGSDLMHRWAYSGIGREFFV
jgi:hypothetical protein